MEGTQDTGAADARTQIAKLQERMGESIIGQKDVIDRLVIGLLANGNLLVEGLPGLAKTRAIKALAKNMECDFSRIQFTPDLLPSDVTGTEVYYQADGGGDFRFEAGPIFANVVLADEINRAPAKIQAALLEAGRLRARPVLLTAGTTLLGNLVITLDPIFSGLAWAIIFGVLASTAFTLLVVPVVYALAYGSNDGDPPVLTEQSEQGANDELA